MKILVLSDSHNALAEMETAVLREKPDRIFHLGDYTADAQMLQANYPGIPMCSVPGNCDRDFLSPPIQLQCFSGVRILLTHGHTLGVKYDLQRLCYAAAEAGAVIALFGHTHCRTLQTYENITLFNPGACSGSSASYGVVEIYDDGRFFCRHTEI